MLTYVVIHLALAPWRPPRREGGGRNTRCYLGQYADMAGGWVAGAGLRMDSERSHGGRHPVRLADTIAVASWGRA